MNGKVVEGVNSIVGTSGATARERLMLMHRCTLEWGRNNEGSTCLSTSHTVCASWTNYSLLK